MDRAPTAEKQTIGGHRLKKRWIILFAIVVALASLIAWLYLNARGNTPLDSYAQKVSFPLYYPSKLPPDYTVDTKSISVDGGLIIYKLTSTTQKPALVFTEQALPPNFDGNKMIGKNAAALAVPTGTLYDVQAGQQGKYILTTDQTLIFVNAASKPDTETINSMMLSLQKIR
jgi:hypothetical protein